ncbi:Amidohydrolase 1 [Pleurostoma richardsiae]|uniref:Amidohydrolase 1 n=1 Tax=Pleurostoma richardsiae TaxID=41990 RepID=A0AA38RK68_9PEZI|nr:Amidohydrolase 1 [Pleurostoma richardsiae]
MPGEIPWQLPPQRRYIFRNASLVDPAEGVVHPNTTVYVSDGLIYGVELATSKEVGGSPVLHDFAALDVDTIEIDLEGKFLCPGLIDCHVHFNAVPGEKGLYAMKRLDPGVIGLRSTRMAKEMIARGFTSARDCGGTSAVLKEAIRDGVVNGPRLFVALNQLTQTGGHGDTRTRHETTHCCGGHLFVSGRLCDGVDECLRVSRDQIRRGADFLKIMGGGGISSPTDAIDSVQFTPEEINTIVGVAKINKTYVSCHAYTPESIRNAIDNGVRAIEHGNLIDEATAALMAEKGVLLTPTLVTYSAMASDRFISYLPPEGVEKNEAVLHAGIRGLEIAEKAGVTMCFGTDLLGPMCSLQTKEFALRAQVLSPQQILRTATVNAAKLLMREAFLGQIKPGFAADLLVLKANPLEDILSLDSPEKNLLLVMKEGRVHISRWSKLAVDIDPPETIE